MSDQQIKCGDCGGSFAFTDSERAFYESKGLASPPKRCPQCRKARKLANPERRAGGFGGAGGPSRGRSGGGGQRNGGGGAGLRAGPGAASEGRGWGKPNFRPSYAPHSAGRPSVGLKGRDPRLGGSQPRGRESPNVAHDVDGSASLPESARGTIKAESSPRRTRPKFDITCASCKAHAQVPFKPLEGREVFCQACYRARRGVAVVHAGVEGSVEVGAALVEAGKIETPID